MESGGVGGRGGELVGGLAEAGNSGDAPVEGSVEDVLVGGEAGGDVGGGGKLSSPEEGGDEEDAEGCAGGNAGDGGEGVGCGLEGGVGAVLEVVAELLPELGAAKVAGEGGEDEAAVVLEVDGGVAGVVGEAANHVEEVGGAVGAAHVGGEHELEVGVEAVGGLKHFGGAADVARLFGPASGVEGEAVDADGLGLLDLALVGGDVGLAGGGVGGEVLVGEHVVREDQALRVGGDGEEAEEEQKMWECAGGAALHGDEVTRICGRYLRRVPCRRTWCWFKQTAGFSASVEMTDLGLGG